jgi:serralysin
MCYACAAQGLSASWATYDHEVSRLDGSGLVQGSTAWDQLDPVRLAATGTTTSATGSLETNAVTSYYRWTGTLTYSFPDLASDYESYVTEATNGFSAVSFDQMQAVRYTLEGVSSYSGGPRMSLTAVEGFTNLSISDAGFNNADIRIAQSSSANPTAYAYLPGSSVYSGDVWFGTSYNYRNPQVGTYSFLTLVHELGHALGLKHTHDSGGVTGTVMPADKDSLEYSVMSYKSYAGQTTSGYTNETYGYAQTYMMYDIAALQAMYGADFTARSSNTVYTWSVTTGETFVDGVGQGAPGGGIGGAANRIFLTLWDGGGIDTYDLSNYTTSLTLDLAPGGHSLFSSTQRAYLGGGHYARGNVFNALQYNGDSRSLIENAMGGSAADTLFGNQAANTLQGNAGGDTLFGLQGADYLIGGAGQDTLDGGAESDTLDGGTGADLMKGCAGNDRYVVDDAGDQVWELAAEGTDTVETSLLAYELTANTENLVYTGAGNAAMCGNNGANVITAGGGHDTLTGGGGNDTLDGGAGNDRLDGGVGADSMRGGAGDDTYLVDHAGDVAVEASNCGTDTILTSLTSYGLAANIENLTAAGAGSFTGTGNELANAIESGGGGDLLSGLGGHDTLIGGAGNDTLYGGTDNDLLHGGSGSDRIDGGAGTDTAVFTGNWADFSILFNVEGFYLVTDDRTAGADEDYLIGVEFLQFLDRVVNLGEGVGEVAPTASPVTLPGGENDESFLVSEAQLLAGASDLNGDVLRVTNLSLAAGTSGALVDNGDDTWTYLPGAGGSTLATFAYTVSDGVFSATSTASLALIPVNSAPVTSISGNSDAGLEDTLITGRVPAGWDVDGQTLSYELVAPVTGLSFEADGTFSYLAPADFYGTASFAYRVVDSSGASSAAATFTLTIAPVNDAPRAVMLNSGTVAENSANGTVVGSVAAFDVDAGDAHWFQLLDDAGGRFAMNGSTLVVANGTLLDYEQSRSHQVVVRATDQDGASFDQILTITLEDVVKERVTGTRGNDKVKGGSGADKLKGGAGHDRIYAGSGKDMLYGGDGNDRLMGGKSADTLVGGKGRDYFVFADKETGVSRKSADYITDFRARDKDRIDLRSIDADTKKKGNQAFSFIGDDDFTKAGQVRYEKTRKETWVYLNTDNDKGAEAAIRLKGAMDLHKGWFLL